MNKFFFIAIMALIGFLPSSVQATHIVGGDMSYKCLGNDFYEVTLTLRRDCVNGAEDAPFDEQAAVGIFDKTGRKLDFLGRLGILYMPFTGQDTIRNNVPECALMGDMVCVHESVYKAQVYLPLREEGYVLSYQRCCRNGTLNNIIDPLETGATRTVCISHESQLACNSGPAFGEYPGIIACANEEISFDASATDPEGDQLVYKLATPYTGASIDYPKPQPPWNPPYNSFVEYASGFSEDNMLGSGTPLSIDENTGLLTGTPSAEGQFLVGILVEEWRDGEKLSETRRDFEFNVKVCQEYPEIAFDVEDNCAGLTVDVTNNSTGAVSYVWNFNHPSTDAQFMSTEQSPGSFTYSEPGIYNIRLEGTDSEGRCVVDVIKEVRALNSQVSSSFTYSNGCCFDGKTELSLVATSEEPSTLYDIASYEYSVTINGEVPMTLSGANRVFEVSCTDQVEVTLVTTSTSGCMATVTEIITIDENFGDIEGNICMEEIIICNGESGTFVGLNELRTYEWTPSSDDLIDLTNPYSPVFTPSETTLYTVVATDANGARSTGTVNVVVVESFELTIGQEGDLKCLSDAPFAANANRDDLTFEWSSTEDFAEVLSTDNPGNITLQNGTNNIYLRATSPEGCQEVAFVQVESSRIDIDFDVEEYNACAQESATVSLINNGGEDVWIVWDESPNIKSDDLNALSIEVAALSDEEVITLGYTASNSEGCELIGTVDVAVTRSIDASITGDLVSCDGNFSLLANSNASGATFEWSLTPDFTTIAGSGANFPITLEEDAIIYMRAAVGQVCVSEIITANLSLGAFEVSFDDIPSEICIGDEVVLTGTSADNTVSIDFGSSANILEVLSPTSVRVTAVSGQSEVVLPYVATNEAGCEVTGEIRMVVGTVPQPNVTYDVDCSTGAVSFATGLADGTQVSWDFGDPNTTDDISSDINPSYTYTSGTYTAVLSSTAATCAFDDVSTEVVVPELFSLESDDGPDVNYCADDEVTITVRTTGDVAVTWVDGEGNVLAEGNVLTFTPNGEISMVTASAVSTIEGCGESSLDFNLDQYIFDITPGDLPTNVCPNEDFMLSVTDNTDSDLTYEWMPSNVVVAGGDTPTATINMSSDGDVVVRITNEFGCSHEEVFSIDLPDVDLTVGADPDPEIFLCDEVVIFAEPGNYSSYAWSNGVSGPTQSVAPTETTTYTVTITDANGCTNTGSVTINVTVPPCDETGIFIPTGFSPNNDGANDVLLVRSNAVKEMDFFIVDRWGNEVFRTTNQRVGWNGQFKNDGRELSSDVYAWCLIATCSSGEDIHLVGNVTLLR